MKRFICVALILCMLFSLAGCKEKEPFEITYCGSGFYFNRPDSKTYKIKALGVESTGNYFFLEDYFVSESPDDKKDIYRLKLRQQTGGKTPPLQCIISCFCRGGVSPPAIQNKINIPINPNLSSLLYHTRA